MADARIPVYLITGFLDSGKTTLLLDTLNMDYFADGQRTVLLRCECGEVEYDQAELSKLNTRIVSVERQEELTDALLDQIERRYQPQRILIEYNGMWPLDRLRNLHMPKDWGLYQIVTLMQGSAFELYRSNLQSMIVDMATEADLVLFNRCTPDMPLAAWKRSIRSVNRQAQIVFEDKDGEELEVEDILPYHLEERHITLENDDYGIWYLDIQEHPQRYIGKTITYRAQALVEKRFPKGTFVPGRNAMTCCADDIRFFGFLCKYDKAKQFKTGQWLDMTAEIRYEENAVYDGEGVVLYATEATPAEKPEEALIYFN